MSERTLVETVEVRAPWLAAIATRLLGRLPPAVRAKALVGAFERAAAAFNRGDLEALFALFDDEVEYVPPPALRPPERLVGRRAVLELWRDVLARYPDSTIVNLCLEESERNRFVRTARLRHAGGAEPELTYEIRQTTELRAGRVARQVNDAAGGG